MDLDNLQQNMNTRVVFREPRGMIRWLQLFFAIIAFSTVADFHTSIGINITCPSDSTSSTTTKPPTTSSSAPSPQPTNSSQALKDTKNSTTTTLPQVSQAQMKHLEFVIEYPFDFSKQSLTNDCPHQNYSYNHVTSLDSSPQFFVTTGILSLIYASSSLVIYLCFSSTYESVPVWPITDLVVAGVLCLLWFISSSSFSSGVTLLKSTLLYNELDQKLCPNQFKQLAGASCVRFADPSWKSLNVGLVCGFTSFFLWGSGMWFVYKETHFHQSRDTYQNPR